MEFVAPFIVGAYEQWLFRTFEKIFESSPPSQFIDVGAATGFYAVAVARKFPSIDVIAFDVDGNSRKITSSMIDVNGVSNVEVRGECTQEWLEDNLKPHSLVLIDIEGGEAELPKRMFPALEQSHCIIETHPNIVPGVTEKLLQMFGGTHHIEVLRRTDAPPLVPVDFLGDETWKVSHYLRVEEKGVPQAWLVCTPK
jgi:hypothetical protein